METEPLGPDEAFARDLEELDRELEQRERADIPAPTVDLIAWLPEGGLRLDDVAYLLRDVDHVRLKEAGMPQDVIRLFS